MLLLLAISLTKYTHVHLPYRATADTPYPLESTTSLVTNCFFIQLYNNNGVNSEQHSYCIDLTCM